MCESSSILYYEQYVVLVEGLGQREMNGEKASNAALWVKQYCVQNWLPFELCETPEKMERLKGVTGQPGL